MIDLFATFNNTVYITFFNFCYHTYTKIEIYMNKQNVIFYS